MSDLDQDKWSYVHQRKMVGAKGFEPSTPATPLRCATRLRYAPKILIKHATLTRVTLSYKEIRTETENLIKPGDQSLESNFEDMQKFFQFNANLANNLLTLVRVIFHIITSKALASSADCKTVLV